MISVGLSSFVTAAKERTIRALRSGWVASTPLSSTATSTSGSLRSRRCSTRSARTRSIGVAMSDLEVSARRRDQRFNLGHDRREARERIRALLRDARDRRRDTVLDAIFGLLRDLAR